MNSILLSIAACSITFISIGLNDIYSSGEKIVASGIVITTKDNSGNITNVKLMAEDTDGYNIILNETGIRLGKEMHNKWVEVTGILYKDGEDYGFEVESYTEIKEGLTNKRDPLTQHTRGRANHKVKGGDTLW